jgi:sarcosine oxidase
VSERFDVIILGLGGMGSAGLAHLAVRGKRVLGLDQFHPAHALGSSHGDSRVIRQAYFEDPAYVPLLLRAYQLWSDLEKQTGRALYRRTGGLMAGHEGSEVVVGSTRSAKEHGLAHEVMTAADIHRRFPAMTPQVGEIGLYEYEAGIIYPEEAILAHLQVAVAAGAQTRFGVKVTGWRATPGGGVQVETSHGLLEADRIVITAGAWLEKAAPELGLPLKIERNIMHWFTPKANASHFTPDRFPVWILQRHGTPVFYGFPQLPGQGVKTAFHHSEAYTSVDKLDRTVKPSEVAAMQQTLAAWLPDAAGEHERAAVCMYTNTPDEHFVVGLHPAHPQVVVAGGFSGHGYKFCTVMGEVLADLATTGATVHPIGLFAPNRFSRQT